MRYSSTEPTTQSWEDRDLFNLLASVPSRLSSDSSGSYFFSWWKHWQSGISEPLTGRIRRTGEREIRTEIERLLPDLLYWTELARDWTQKLRTVSAELPLPVDDCRIKESAQVLTLPSNTEVYDFCYRNKLLEAYQVAKTMTSYALESLNVISSSYQEAVVKYVDEEDEKIVIRVVVENSIQEALDAERKFYRLFYREVSVPQRFYFVFSCNVL